MVEIANAASSCSNPGAVMIIVLALLTLLTIYRLR
jgi:hypothetical protein